MSIQSSSDYEDRGKSLLHLGRVKEALAVLQEGERKFPGDAELLLGASMAKLKLGDYAGSGAILEDLRLRHPSSEVLRALAEAYLGRGMMRPALEAAVQAVNAGGRDAEVPLGLARAFYQRKKYTAALTFYQRAVETSPQWAEAHFGLGACLWALKQPADALKALRRAVELAPEDWQARQFLGCVLADSGFKDESRAVLEAIPLDAPWQKAALERLVAMAWWPSDPARSAAMEEAWRKASATT